MKSKFREHIWTVIAVAIVTWIVFIMVTTDGPSDLEIETSGEGGTRSSLYR